MATSERITAAATHDLARHSGWQGEIIIIEAGNKICINRASASIALFPDGGPGRNSNDRTLAPICMEPLACRYASSLLCGYTLRPLQWTTGSHLRKFTVGPIVHYGEHSMRVILIHKGNDSLLYHISSGRPCHKHQAVDSRRCTRRSLR